MQTKLEAGLEYEIYVKNIIKDKYKNTWLWSELPQDILIKIGCIKNITDKCDDIGCDIVCQYHNDTFVFIQCKNYSTTGVDNTINIGDLAGFYNFIAETGFNGIVYYSGRLSQQIVYRKKKITYINLPHIKNNKILDFKPYEYQIEAYNKLKNNNRSILVLSTVRPNLENYLFIDNKIYSNNLITSTGFAVITATKINSKYLYNYISTSDVTNYLVNSATGAMYPSVDKENLNNINIPIPTNEVQEYIVKECDYYDNLIDILEKENERLQNNKIIELMLNSVPSNDVVV